MTAPPARVRVDVWLWAVRLYKTRSQATAACVAGHVKVNGERAKPASAVRIGDRVAARTDRDRLLVVRGILLKRSSAPIAQEAYTDFSPPPPPREERPLDVLRDRGAGRPTKRDRRAIDRLLGG